MSGDPPEDWSLREIVRQQHKMLALYSRIAPIQSNVVMRLLLDAILAQGLKGGEESAPDPRTMGMIVQGKPLTLSPGSGLQIIENEGDVSEGGVSPAYVILGVSLADAALNFDIHLAPDEAIALGKEMTRAGRRLAGYPSSPEIE